MLNAQRLKDLRKQKGLKQVDVAIAISIERTTYVKYEKSGIQPPTDIVVKLAKLLNTTTDYLLGNTDDPTPQIEKTLPTLTGEDALLILAREKNFSKSEMEYLKQTINFLESQNNIREFKNQIGSETSKETFPKFS